MKSVKSGNILKKRHTFSFISCLLTSAQYFPKIAHQFSGLVYLLQNRPGVLSEKSEKSLCILHFGSKSMQYHCSVFNQGLGHGEIVTATPSPLKRSQPSILSDSLGFLHNIYMNGSKNMRVVLFERYLLGEHESTLKWRMGPPWGSQRVPKGPQKRSK